MLKTKDPKIYNLIKKEELRLKNTLQMIASENSPSKEVLEALGSVFNFKYSEGYPYQRYYQGTVNTDEVEVAAEERARNLFKVPFVNVQPYSGSPANAAVQLALLKPLKSKIMGLSLAYGGHLTHGASVSFSGKLFKTISYELNKEGLLDYGKIKKIAIKEKPDLIICGATAYPRIIDFKKFAEIADKVGAYLLADISHIAGLIVAGVHPSPARYAHIITTTTHKTLRGPRGALIMVTNKGIKKDPNLSSKIDKAVFPGLQGGPHQNQTAAIAVALKEASGRSFKKYGEQVVRNSKVLAAELKKHGFNLVSGGTDNHLILIDLRNKAVNGAIAALALETAGIILNKNAVPNDQNPPFYPAGLRLGTAALTTQGMKEREMVKIAKWINEVINECPQILLPKTKGERKIIWDKFKKDIAKAEKLLKIAKEVKFFCARFPLP
ncbi:MAG: serine hydroxymethyltransferase [Candidatus Levybacteria bacterium RBG_16_35_11]|nr:MAG: serine hydroxymethyltransferase [Candidatus Levybacteria bacterium RBG_16_35_11]